MSKHAAGGLGTWHLDHPGAEALDLHSACALLLRAAHDAHGAGTITDEEYGRLAHTAMKIQLAVSELRVKGFL